MRKRGAAGIAALVGLGLVVSVAPAQAQTYYRPAPTFQGKIWDGLFSNAPKMDETDPFPTITSSSPLSSTSPAKGDAPAASSSPTPSGSARAREQDRLMKVFLRREAVSDRIRDIGVATNNATLIEEATYLREKAWQLYMKQVGSLAGTAAPLEADNVEGGKPVHSAASLSQAAGASDTRRIRDTGKSAQANQRPTAATREDEE